MNRLCSIPAMLVLCGWFSLAEAQAEDKKTESPTESAKKLTEITLERSGDGDGPSDTLTLRSDGTALYVGKKNVERIGRFKGTISEHGFHDSFQLVAEQYAALRGQAISTGKPTGGRVTAVTIHLMWDGKKQEIVDLCPGLDRKLWSLEMAVRGVSADIMWKKDEAKAP